jgi:hypothetical protein
MSQGFPGSVVLTQDSAGVGGRSTDFSEKLTNILASSMLLLMPLPFAPNSSLGATL